MPAYSKTKTKADEVEVVEPEHTLPLEARVIQYITNFPAPTTTQDSVDKIAAELATASLMRTQAEKRYEVVKRLIFDEFSVYISEVRIDATEHMQKATAFVKGSDWQLDFAANKPALRVDTDKLRTELVKRSVPVDLIDDAIKEATKKATPATIITATQLA